MQNSLINVKKIICAFAAALLTVGLIPTFSMQVKASEVTTAFGSNYYNADANGQNFPIGVYLRSQSGIGEYTISIAYDGSRLKYISGADSDNDSIVTLSGDGNGQSEVKVMIYFNATSGGKSGVRFVNASAKDSSGSDMDVSALAEAPVNITGKDTSNKAFKDVLNDAEAAFDSANDNAADTASGSSTASGSEETGTENTFAADENASDDSANADADDSLGSSKTLTDPGNPKDGFTLSRNSDIRRAIITVIVIIFIILLLLIVFFVTRLIREGNSFSHEDNGKDPDGDEFDDSDDDGIWDDIRRKPVEHSDEAQNNSPEGYELVKPKNTMNKDGSQNQ